MSVKQIGYYCLDVVYTRRSCDLHMILEVKIDERQEKHHSHLGHLELLVILFIRNPVEVKGHQLSSAAVLSLKVRQ